MNLPDVEPTPRSTLLLATTAALLLTGLGGFAQAITVPTGQALAEKATAADTQGQWQAPFDSEIPAVNIALTPDGDVVYYDGAEAKDHSHDGDPGPHAHPDDATFFTTDAAPSESRVYDPSDGAITTPDDDPVVDLFCSGTTVRPDGDVMTVGGTKYPSLGEEGKPVADNPEIYGTDEVFKLNSEDDESWTDEPDMNLRRWYPTVIETADGGALAAAGIKNLSEAETHNVYLEKKDPDTDQWRKVEPEFHVAEGVSIEHQGRVMNTELAPANLPMYPKLFVVPNGPHAGEVVYPANGDLWAPFGERPEEALWGTFQFVDPDDGDVTFAGASPFGPRHLGNAVPLMLDPADDHALDVLSVGGTLERTGLATNTAEIVSVEGDSIESEPAAAMDNPRWNPNSVLLPTGDVVTVGGASFDNVLVYGQDKAPVLEAELYDTSEDEWSTLASMQLPRDYHSTALLLPSGEVLAGGHVPLPDPPRDVRENVPGQDQNTIEKFEVFEPPYLHNDEDTRPEITSVSNQAADPADDTAVAAIEYQETFTVQVEGLDENPKEVGATLVRPGAVTHTVDADQRGIRLTVENVEDTGQGKKLELTAPPDANVAPPANYMLFVNEDLGGERFPSEAEFVQIGPDGFFD